MKNKWWADRASEIQEAYDKHNTKQLYASLKTVYGPRQTGSIPVRSADNQLLTEPDLIINRWAEHFQDVLNQPSTFDTSVLNEIPDWDTNNDLDVPPTLAETLTAIKQLSSNKAPGADGLPAEIYMSGGTTVAMKLTEIFKHIWMEGVVPQDFKDAKLIHLYKKKGDRSLCDNHRGISLLSVAGKILARILLTRLSTHVATNDILPESQCGFRLAAARQTWSLLPDNYKRNAKSNKKIYIWYLLISQKLLIRSIEMDCGSFSEKLVAHKNLLD